MMKRVLLISNNGMGFYNFKKELVFELLTQGYEVHFAVPTYEKLGRLISKGAVYHEITIDRRGINPVKDLDLMHQFRRLIREIKPDVILSHTIKPNIYASTLARHYGIPYINNITGLGSALQSDGMLAKMLRMMYRHAVFRSSGIFFENEGNKNYFKKYYIGRAENYIVVPGAGVNTEEFAPERKHEKKSEREDITFLFIGRIMKEKGIDEFFKAAEHIKKKYPATRFQVVGYYDENAYAGRIARLVNQKIIEYLGVSLDTRIQMVNADCIVLPSYHEGMSNVLLEGAAMGLPLITTNIHGCKEAVTDGITGFLCEPRNVDSLISALKKFIALSTEERSAMGLAGRKKIEKEFDRNLVIDQYISRIHVALME